MRSGTKGVCRRQYDAAISDGNVDRRIIRGTKGVYIR